MTAYRHHPYPPVRAYAITGPDAVTVTPDLARAQQVAPHMHGVISTLYNAPALWDHLQRTAYPSSNQEARTMNRVRPDPTAVHTGAIEHLALCMHIAHTTALGTIRSGTLIAGDDGATWWLDMTALLDPQQHSSEHIDTVSSHIAVAVFAGQAERHPQHPLRLRIVAGQPQQPPQVSA